MSWYCLYSTVAGELRALADLEAHSFTAYLPRATQIVTRRGRRQERQTPLLPRYLFVCLPDFNRIGIVTKLVTIADILPHEMPPQRIPTSEIESLQEREAAGEFVFKSTVSDRRRRKRILHSFKELAQSMNQV